MSWFSAFYSQQRLLRVLTSVIVVAPAFAHAQSKAKTPKVEDKNAAVTMQAEQTEGRPAREVILRGNAEIVRDKTKVTADEVIFKQVDNEIEAQGKVNMRRFDDFYTGDKLKLNLDSGAGFILAPTYKLELNHAQGHAEKVNFIDQENAEIVNGTYSTCESNDPAWYLKSDTLNLDFGRDVGSAGKTLVYFKGVPILGTPAMSFPLTSARRTGLLPPSIGATSTGGVEFTLPYYFNIAPNRDLTLFPKLISRRGFQLGMNARYLGQTYQGETNIEVLPNDRKADRTRYSIASLSRHDFLPGASFSWNLNKASDDNYPNDFAGSGVTNPQRQLIRELRLDYAGSYWNTWARVQNFQILQDAGSLLDPTLTVDRPYDRLPELGFSALRRDVAGLDLQMEMQWARFWHPDKTRGQRLVINPQISYPILSPAYFFTPKLSLHVSRYQIDQRAKGETGDSSLARVVPTFSIDSGLQFERSTSFFGRNVTQTLEPRLFYVNTPYREQKQFPLFDSAEAGFNFAQLFSENRFTGNDRISDANQITAALVSRVLETDGAERLRFALGQRFYFRNQKVALDPNGTEVKDSRSDLLLSASGTLSPQWNFDSGLQYSVSKHQVYAANYGVQWQPKAKHVVNAEYRYLRNSFELLNLSGQWPIANRYFAVGRISYSLPERQTVKSLAGFEYNADCWVFRFAAQRFSTSTNGATTTLFLQLELNGLSRIGSNPLDALSKNIPGYQKVNQPDGDRP
ncbi:MAG: LPS-assembly protein LptD [Burkholderiales bacterium]|nr:LPS-assembly protein LptD [Burkholderiales bacterium]